MKFYRTLLKLQRDQKREIEAWKAARKVATFTKNTEDEISKSTLSTPRKMSRKEMADREKRLKDLDAWKQRKAEEKLAREKEIQQLADNEKKRRADEARQRERILKLREIEVANQLYKKDFY